MNALRIATVNSPWKGLVWLLLLFFSGCYAGDPPYTAYYTYVQYRAPSAQEWQPPPSVKDADPLPVGEYALVVTRFSPPKPSGEDGEVGGSKCPMTQVITSVVLTVHSANDVTDNDYLKKPEHNWLKLKRFTCTTNYSPLTLWLIHLLVPSVSVDKRDGIDDANSRVSLLRQLLKLDPEEQLPQEPFPQSTRLIRVHRLLEKEKLSQEQIRDLGDFFDPNTVQKDPSLKALQSSVATTEKTDAQDPHGTRLFSAFARQIKSAKEDTKPGTDGKSDAKKNDGHQGAQDAANAPKPSNNGNQAGTNDGSNTPSAAGGATNATPHPPADTGSHENKNEGYSTTTVVLVVGILLSLIAGLLTFVLKAASQGGAQRRSKHLPSVGTEDPYHVDHENHASQDRTPSVSRSFWAGFHPHRGAIQAESPAPVETTHKAGLEERVSQLESYHIKTMSSIKAQEKMLGDGLISLRGDLDAWRNELALFVNEIKKRITYLEQKSSNTTTGYDTGTVDARVTLVVRKELEAVTKQMNKLTADLKALNAGVKDVVAQELEQHYSAITSILNKRHVGLEALKSVDNPQVGITERHSFLPFIPPYSKMDDLVKALITIEALTQKGAEDLRQNASTTCELVSRWVEAILASNQSLAMYRRYDSAIRKETNDQIGLIVEEGVDLDPDRHKVVASERVDRGTLNRVLVLVLPGVECNGRVVRKAEVVVSR